MSQKELSRLEIINKVIDKRLTQNQASKHLNLSRRQICRLIDAYKVNGAKGLVSKKRDQPSNRRYPDYFCEYVLEIIRSNYADFGPTLVCEKLLEVHEIGISLETVRAWMLAADIWTSRAETANAYLPQFIEQFNQKFAKPARSDNNSHRPFTDFDNLDQAMSWQETRTVSKSLTIQYDKVLFLLEPSEFAAGLKRKSVTVIILMADWKFALKAKVSPTLGSKNHDLSPFITPQLG